MRCTRCHTAQPSSNFFRRSAHGRGLGKPEPQKTCSSCHEKEATRREQKREVLCAAELPAPVIACRPCPSASEVIARRTPPGYKPAAAVIAGVQGLLDVLEGNEPEIIIVQQLKEAYAGKYINTGVSAEAVVAAPPSLVLEDLRRISADAPGAAIIDTADNSLVALVVYRNAKIFAHRERIVALFTEKQLKDNLCRIERGESHADLGPMFAYGHRAPQGGKVGQEVWTSHYAQPANANPAFRKALEALMLPFSETWEQCFPADYSRNDADVRQWGLPTLVHNKVSTVFVTLYYRSASHTDFDRSFTMGLWLKVGDGQVIGSEFLFPAHRVAVPLHEGCLILWDGNKPHCTALAEYRGAHYVATVLTTPGRLFQAVQKRNQAAVHFCFRFSFPATIPSCALPFLWLPTSHFSGRRLPQQQRSPRSAAVPTTLRSTRRRSRATGSSENDGPSPFPLPYLFA